MDMQKQKPATCLLHVAGTTHPRKCCFLSENAFYIILKREVLAVTRTVERRVQRTVIGSAHVDVLPHVNVRVTLLRCRMALQEGVVVFPVAHQHDDIERQTSSRATGAVLSF